MWFRLDRLLALAVLYSTCEAKEYIGCYGDIRGDREHKAFQTWAGGSDDRTVDNCISRCQNTYRKTYAGLQNGRECWCGNGHQEYKRHGESRNCNYRCSGDGSQICGGEDANSVYAVCPRGYYRKGISSNCDARCHCTDDVICQYEDGRCPNGACAEGWTGSACQYRDCNVHKGGCQHSCVPQKVTNWCSCHQGYAVSDDDFTQCTDIDECENIPVDCGRRTCVNTHGSYECTTQCQDGYIMRPPLTYVCIDINECEGEGENNCQHRCENVEGSYRCTCHTGYGLKSNGFGCDDIDECIEIDVDPSCHSCQNTIGSYTCLCNHGYQHSMDLTRCEDIDECLLDYGGCNNTCVNTPGSFHCTCPPGYAVDKVDGRTCVVCSVGYFGVECTERCHCEDRLPCDQVNGTCRSPGCLTGYTGSSCKTMDNDHMNNATRNLPAVSINLGVIVSTCTVVLVSLVALVVILGIRYKRREALPTAGETESSGNVQQQTDDYETPHDYLNVTPEIFHPSLDNVTGSHPGDYAYAYAHLPRPANAAHSEASETYAHLEQDSGRAEQLYTPLEQGANSGRAEQLYTPLEQGANTGRAEQLCANSGRAEGYIEMSEVRA